VVTNKSTESLISKETSMAYPATVKSIEYDPNRTARIAFLYYADGEKRYIVAPEGLQVGDTLCLERKQP